MKAIAFAIMFVGVMNIPKAEFDLLSESGKNFTAGFALAMFIGFAFLYFY